MHGLFLIACAALHKMEEMAACLWFVIHVSLSSVSRCGNSQNLRNFPACIYWWVGGLATLVVHVVPFHVLTCVCLGPSVQRSPPDFVQDMLVLVCAVTPPVYPASRAATPVLHVSLLSAPSSFCCLKDIMRAQFHHGPAQAGVGLAHYPSKLCGLCQGSEW